MGLDRPQHTLSMPGYSSWCHSWIYKCYYFRDQVKVMLLGHDDGCMKDKNMKATLALDHFGPICKQRMPTWLLTTLAYAEWIPYCPKWTFTVNESNLYKSLISLRHGNNAGSLGKQSLGRMGRVCNWWKHVTQHSEWRQQLHWVRKQRGYISAISLPRPRRGTWSCQRIAEVEKINYRETDENPPEYPQTNVLDFSTGNTDERLWWEKHVMELLLCGWFIWNWSFF